MARTQRVMQPLKLDKHQVAGAMQEIMSGGTQPKVTKKMVKAVDQFCDDCDDIVNDPKNNITGISLIVDGKETVVSQRRDDAENTADSTHNTNETTTDDTLDIPDDYETYIATKNHNKGGYMSSQSHTNGATMATEQNTRRTSLYRQTSLNDAEAGFIEDLREIKSVLDSIENCGFACQDEMLTYITKANNMIKSVKDDISAFEKRFKTILFEHNLPQKTKKQSQGVVK